MRMIKKEVPLKMFKPIKTSQVNFHTETQQTLPGQNPHVEGQQDSHHKKKKIK